MTSVVDYTSPTLSGGSGVFLLFLGPPRRDRGGDTFIWGDTTNTFTLNYVIQYEVL